MTATDVPNIKKERRRHIRRRITLLVIISLSVAAGASTWLSHSSSPGHKLIYSETLPDGRVFQCFSDGAAIGAPGTEVDARPAPAGPEGSEGSPALVVRPPDYTEDEARKAMEEYQKSGRSLEQDQADFDRLSAECRRRR